MPFTNNMDQRSGPMKRWAWSSIHIVGYPASVFAENWLYCVGLLELCDYISFVKFTNCPRTFRGHCKFIPDLFCSVGKVFPWNTHSKYESSVSINSNVIANITTRLSCAIDRQAKTDGRTDGHSGQELQSKLDISTSDISNSARLKASIWIKNTF